MICDNCRHEIGPEDLKCPNCGADNPFALQHAKNMEEYEAAYKETEEKARQFAGNTASIGKRAAILAILLIGIVVMLIVSRMNYADPDSDKAVIKDAVKNVDLYSDMMEEYLENGEYMECASFIFAHEIKSLHGNEYARFGNIDFVIMDYYECIRGMEDIVFRSNEADYFSSLDTDINNYCMYLEDFYSTYANMKLLESNAQYLSYMDDMETELRTAMRVYFSMDEEEIDSFLKMTRAGKAVKIEEVLDNEE
ncbi:MAG: hypothetical protein K5662_03910 [Lachnospiraceae bacterium]|nr:hypothetical protein [Lachnospiraceae bacterium]